MKKLIFLLALVATIVLSGCCICPWDGGERGTMTLKYGYAWDFDDMVYRDYEPENSCIKDSQRYYKEIGLVPDIAAYRPDQSQSGCINFGGLHCEETSFGTYIKHNENVMDLGEISLDQATVPAVLEGQGWEVCAEIGHTYYLRTWGDTGERDVLLYVKEFTDEGIVVDYIIR